MDILGSVTKSVLSGLGGGGQGMFGVVKQILGGGGQAGGQAGQAPAAGAGGIGALVKLFQANGLKSIIDSWIGTGKNLPITPQQLDQVFGNEQLKGMASQLGVSTDQLRGQLAKYLPTVVDQMTPDGKVPDEAEWNSRLEKLA